MKVSHPFQATLLESVFDGDFYDRLEREFPSPVEASPFLDPGRKWNINEANPRFMKVLERSWAFRAFYSFCRNNGQRFLDDTFPGNGLRARGARFEFSFLPADGGCVYPHPDTPHKLATFVFFFPPREWDPGWGGGLDLYVHKTFGSDKDFTDWRERSWENVEVAHCLPYQPNSVAAFVRCGHSLHGVRPMSGPGGIWRRSVTLNVLG